jgi:hypothetical protein
MITDEMTSIDRIFRNKTVASVEVAAVNSWVFRFSDGTFAEIVSDDAVLTQYGNVSGIFVVDDSLVVEDADEFNKINI